mmetsp:Transcript_24192/g.68530  ORF Transcript_24192/g.68530 Transcript_24192/m.68530 type:complete len:462 (+) Transcript_24192:97-1482(+)
MSSSFQEVRYESNAQNPVARMGNAVCCSLLGLFLMYPGGLFLLGWNEQRTVCVERAVLAAEEAMTEVKCNAEPRDYKGDLVFASCPVNSESLKEWSPADIRGVASVTGLFAEKALRLQMNAEMYQCVEEKHERKEKSRDGKETKTITTYTYKMQWRDHHIDSASFKSHREAKDARYEGCWGMWDNPAFTVTGETKSVQTLTAGSFDATRHMNSVPIDTPVQLRKEAIQAKPWFANKDAQPPQQLDSSNTVVGGEYLYTCDARGDMPQGCMRLSFKTSSARHVSLLAKLNADGTSRGWRSPGSWMCSSRSSSSVVDFFAPRDVSADDAITDLLLSNGSMKWLCRLGGILLAWFGIHTFLSPIQALADIVNDATSLFRCIPILGWALDFLGDVVSGAVGCVLTMVSFGVAVPTSLLVMSVMWVFMRPLLGIPMLLAGLVGLFFAGQQMIALAIVGKERKVKKA